MWHHHLDLQSLFLATDHRQGLDLWNSGGPHHLGHEAFSLIWKDINVMVSHVFINIGIYVSSIHSYSQLAGFRNAFEMYGEKTISL